MEQASTDNVIDIRDKDIQGPIFQWLLENTPGDKEDYTLLVTTGQRNRIYDEAMGAPKINLPIMGVEGKVTGFRGYHLEVKDA